MKYVTVHINDFNLSKTWKSVYAIDGEAQKPKQILAHVDGALAPMAIRGTYFHLTV